MENTPKCCLLRVAMSAMVIPLFLSAWRVANHLLLVVVEEQMSNAMSFLLLFSSCFAPPTLLQLFLLRFSRIAGNRSILNNSRQLWCADYSLPLTF